MNKKESVPESIFGFILCSIFAGLIYNYFEYSLWRNLGIGFFILGGIGSIYLIQKLAEDNMERQLKKEKLEKLKKITLEKSKK